MTNIKQKQQELARLIKRKERKTEVLFANLKVRGRIGDVVAKASSEMLAPLSNTKDPKQKIDAVKIFSQKLRQQLASDREKQINGRLKSRDEAATQSLDGKAPDREKAGDAQPATEGQANRKSENTTEGNVALKIIMNI